MSFAKIERSLMSSFSFQPVIILGAARSGTKMLRDVIAKHPVFDRVPYDINFIWRLGNESVAHDELNPEILTPRSIHRIQKKIAGFHKEGEFLIEKTVSNCLRVSFVDTIFANAKYIFLLRDGCDVVESSYRQWVAPTDWSYLIEKARSFPFMDAPGYALKYLRNMLKNHESGTHRTWGPRYKGIDEDVATKDLFEVCALQWFLSVEKARSSLEQIEPSRKLIVRYEDFVRQPRQQLVNISAFLGIDSLPYENHSVLSLIRPENIGKGWHRLTHHQQQMLRPLTRQVFAELDCEAASGFRTV
jgi:hypothetical protein